jgi:signal transduction histidine kinase
MWMLRLAGLLFWGLSAVPPVFELLTAPGSEARLLPGLCALSGFGGAFWLCTHPRLDTGYTTPWHLAVGAVETVSALVGIYFLGGYIAPALLIVIAGQLPGLVSFRVGLGWVLAQSAGLELVLLQQPAPPDGRLMFVLGMVTFQLFALGATTLVSSEAQARKALARANAELLGTQALLAETSRTVERLRISRELHDVLGHHLTALLLQLEATARVPPEKSSEYLQKALAQTRTLITETRAAVSTLREEGSMDVRPALRSLVQGIDLPRVHLTLDEDLGLREPATAHVLVRCVQEILTNALRHSGAENLWVSCVRGDGRVEIRARDDGRGAEQVRPGHGLRGMRERLEEMGGGLEVRSAPGQGFSVHAWLPSERTP